MRAYDDKYPGQLCSSLALPTSLRNARGFICGVAACCQISCWGLVSPLCKIKRWIVYSSCSRVQAKELSKTVQAGRLHAACTVQLVRDSCARSSQTDLRRPAGKSSFEAGSKMNGQPLLSSLPVVEVSCSAKRPVHPSRAKPSRCG